MARFLSPTLTLTLTRLSSPSSPSLLNCHSSRLLGHRSQSAKAQLIEIDLDSSSDGDAEMLPLRRLEDVVHSIIVRRSAPDWIPFIPGTSYWVPPRPRGHQFVEIVRKMTNPLSKEEELSLSTVHGWPCSSFFVDGVVPHNPEAAELGVKVHVQSSPEEESQEKASQSED
ncbi:hypothetical protein Dimus_002392 [Dionaea muscipula]